MSTSNFKEHLKPSVLVVDDEPKICSLIKRFLDQSHLFRNVVTADTVGIALMKIRNEEFDLVIIDYNLPDKQGTEFIDIVSKSIKHRKMKYLLISGYLDNRSMMDVINVGVKNVLVKPFTRLSLINKVCEIMNLKNPYTAQE